MSAVGVIEASVIIPALNAAGHIEEQLQALAGQRTEVSWELVVADNGSTDGTRAIVEHFAPRLPVPVRVIDASVRPGLSAARNIGMGAGVGEFLLVTDADDVVDELWVQEMVLALRAYPFVGGKLETLRLNGGEVASWRPAVAVDSLPVMGGRPWVMGCNFGCTAEAFRQVGGFQEGIVGWDDVDFSLAMDAHGMPAVFAERAIVHYRHRPKPAQAVRQLWSYGRDSGRRYSRYGVLPPTFVDVLIGCERSAKGAVRDGLQGRRPVRHAVSAAFTVGEAVSLWREPSFWQPVCRREFPANPLTVQRERLGRLRGLFTDAVRTRRGEP